MKKYFLILVVLSVCLHVNVSGQTRQPPNYKFFIADKSLEPTASIATGELTRLTVKLAPESTPADPNVKYTIQWTLYIRTGSTLGVGQSGTGEALSPGIIGSAKPGEVVVLEINRVTRTDAGGKREILNPEAKYLSIAVTK